jgi:hypothetical protein
MHPLFKKLAIYLLVLLSAYSSITYLISVLREWNPRLVTNDGVYDWDTRLADARADLPADVKVIGYVSEWDVLPDYDYPDNETEYVLTQFAMAPVIVTREDQHEWILVNLSPKDFETWSASQPAYIKVIKYKQGIYLVHKP